MNKSPHQIPSNSQRGFNPAHQKFWCGDKWQLVILWLVGIVISAIFCLTGLKLLAHAACSPELWETGYPLTLLAGTAWAYIVPIIIIGVLLIVTVKGKGNR